MQKSTTAQNELTFSVRRMQDPETLQAFLRVAGTFAGINELSTTTNIAIYRAVRSNNGPASSDQADWVERLEASRGERLIQTLCRWQQDNYTPVLKLERPPNTSHDLLTLSTHGVESFARKIVDAILQNFKEARGVDDLATLLPVEYQKYAERLEKSLAERTADVDRILSKVVDAQVKFTEQIELRQQAHERKLEESRNKHQSELEKQRREAETQLEEKRGQVTEERTKLAQERAELDMRASRAKRREHEKELHAKLKEHSKYTLSKESQDKRVPVHIAAGLLIAAALGGWAWTARYLVSTQEAKPHGTAVFVSLTVVVGVLLWFYLRFLASWFRGRAETEASVKRLEEDFIRAQWLVEIMFEWPREQDGPIPWDVIRRLSEGLFQGPSAVSVGSDHPWDDLLRRLEGGGKFFGSRKGVRIEFPAAPPPPEGPRP